MVVLAFAARGHAADEDAVLSSLRVPDGFTVERVAGSPLVEHPIMAGFDDRGRLFVADNAGLNLPAAELLTQLPNAIRMLEDTDGDGRFDRSTLFADKMTFPQGAAWFRGALYVASPPSIWRLEDTDGDGVADRREEIVQKFGFVGNAADIHGCFITPTGRIAWCDGRHGHELKEAAGQAPSKGLAARVFSCRPDGSQVEVFCGGGMDNPVEVAFTSEGDTIGTMTFYNPDEARHDALVHFVYGGVYPKKHPCTAEFKRTGDLMPALTRFGVTAPSGLARAASPAWGEEYRDNLYSAQFNTHKVLRHQLTRQGATYNCVDQDILVSNHVDFHPTDVLEDADGSLLVIDTGGWFRIGCPTSQIAKPDVGGAIYRIRRKAAKAVPDLRGLQIDWARTSDTEMADLMADTRPAVAERAIEWLVARGDAAMGSLATAMFESTDYRGRENAVWALARIGTENARLLLRQALADDDAPVRQAAVHAVSDLRDKESLYRLIEMIASDEPAVVREVATALGRLGKPEAVPSLLAALAKPADRFVEHSVIFALIELNSPQATLAGLSNAGASVSRGALIALDQMDSQPLRREMIVPLLASDDPALMGTLIEILSRHSDWADELTTTLATWFSEPTPSEEQLVSLRGAAAALIGRPKVQELIAKSLIDKKTAKPIRLALLETLAADDAEKSAARWTAAIEHNLDYADAEILRQAILTSSRFDTRVHSDRLMQIGLDSKQPATLRIGALCAASKNKISLPPAGFEFLAGELKSQSDMHERLSAAEALGRFELSATQLDSAAQLVATCGPLELSWLLRAFEHDSNQPLGLLLVDSLTKSAAVESIGSERLRETLKHYPRDVQLAAKPLFDRKAPDEAERVAKLKSIEPLLEGGDSAHGEEIFSSQRAACSACHRIGTRGEKIGPDLTKIGEVRSRRDLVEAIVFPSASLARGYESFHAVTKSGQIHAGLLSRETAMAIYLRTSDRVEIRIERADVEELSPSRTSIMPQGLEKTLSPVELRDLVAYLSSLK